jgi:hypothetical protein
MIVRNPMKCAQCGQVTIFEIDMPAAGKPKSLQFKCAYGDHLATNAAGGGETVDLKNYDESRLKKVRL